MMVGLARIWRLVGSAVVDHEFPTSEVQSSHATPGVFFSVPGSTHLQCSFAAI